MFHPYIVAYQLILSIVYVSLLQNGPHRAWRRGMHASNACTALWLKPEVTLCCLRSTAAFHHAECGVPASPLVPALCHHLGTFRDAALGPYSVDNPSRWLPEACDKTNIAEFMYSGRQPQMTSVFLLPVPPAVLWVTPHKNYCCLCFLLNSILRLEGAAFCSFVVVSELLLLGSWQPSKQEYIEYIHINLCYCSMNSLWTELVSQ